MKAAAIALALSLVALTPTAAYLGDTPARTAARYGPPVASTGKPGDAVSTQTFQVSGLVVTCGYVNGKVEMETYARDDRGFNSAEVEALLRSNGSERLQWTLPKDGYVDGDYTRSDGVTATLAGPQLVIQTPAWTKALAQEQSAATTGAKASTATSTNGGNPNYTVGGSTNAASYVETAGATNGASATNAP